MTEPSPRDETASASPRRRSRATRPSSGSRLRLADVRQGEVLYVGGAALTLGGIVAAHVALETARDALFLAELPPQGLSLVYLAMAALGFVAARYDHTVARALGRTNALILALMTAALGTSLFYLTERTTLTTFLLYLWTGVVGTVLTVQFWLFAGQRMTPAQGRRLYGLIAAGGVLGAVLGGLVAQVMTAWLPVESLLLLGAGAHLATAFLLTFAPSPAMGTAAPRPAKFRDAVSVLGQNSYLLRIGVLTVMCTAALLITDYLFKSVTATSVPKARLGSFLATYYTVLNVAALVVQVFLAMRVLQRAGTVMALLLLPTLLLFGGGATIAFGGTLIVVLAAKGVDGALRHSLHRVSTELLFLPLSPEDRSRAKSLFDSVLTRASQGVAALLLLALAEWHLDDPVVLGGLLVGLAVAWILVALSLRGPYLDQFRRALGREGLSGGIDLDQLTLDGAEVVLEALSSPEERRVIGAMSVFAEAGRTGLIPALVLYHPSPNVLVRALELIPSDERKDWPPLAERLMDHEDARVRLAAVRALGRYGRIERLDPEKFRAPDVVATAAFFHADRLLDPAHHPLIRQLTEPSADPAAQAALLRAIAEFGNETWSNVLAALEQMETQEFDVLLPTAIAKTRDTRFLSALTKRLSKRSGRVEVRAALVALGTSALEHLDKTLHAPDTPEDIRLHVPRAISRFGTPRAAAMLLDALDADLPGAVRYKALRGLGRLVKEQPLRLPERRVLAITEENVREFLRSALVAARLRPAVESSGPEARTVGELLVSLLEDKQRQSLERVTRLLQLLHPREDLRRVYFALVGSDRDAKVAASELLEVLTLGYDEGFREGLRALADPTAPLEASGQQLPVEGQIDSDVDALREAVTDRDPALSALAAEYARAAEVLEVSVEVERVMENNAWLSDVMKSPTLPPPPMPIPA